MYDFASSNQEEGNNKDSDINDRQENSGDDSYQQLQNRIKQKYGITNKEMLSPDISPERASISSRYEMLTGKSPSAELLTSSLDDLLKTLKNKFGGKEQTKEGDKSGSQNPIDTIQRLLASSIAGGGNSSPLRKMQMAVA